MRSSPLYTWLWMVLVLLVTKLKYSEQGKNERTILNNILSDYNLLERPVVNESEALVVRFGLTLQQILDVEWNDYHLRWNPDEFGGIEDLRIDPKKLWRPDVLMYNSADEKFDGTYLTNIVVNHNGSCLFIPPGIFKSTCKIDITWFPFDEQKCDMKFGSWTYDGWKLDLVMKDETGDTSTFIPNGEWDLLALPGKRNVMTYECCPTPYVDITFTINIRRRTLYYFSTLIIPCVLISSMALLGFTLPPDSGEKLTLEVTILLSLTFFLNITTEMMPETSEAVPLIGVTILLSLTVFLNLVAAMMPNTSDAVPLIGTYFNCIMFMVASSVVLTVVVLNYHHRTGETHSMPQWISTLFLNWLPWLLRMSRPGRKITRKSILLSNKMKELELKERSSRSLLANVLDMDDDLRGTLGVGALAGMQYPGMDQYTTSAATVTGAAFCTGTHRELQAMLRELRFITARIRKDDDIREIISDWKFAAMVVDRFCLIVFTVFTLVATVAILLTAPHILIK